MEDIITTDLVPVEDSTSTTTNLIVTTAVIAAAVALPLGYVIGNLIVGKIRSWRNHRQTNEPVVVVTND